MLEPGRKTGEQVREDNMRNFDYTADMYMEGLSVNVVMECRRSERCWVEAGAE